MNRLGPRGGARCTDDMQTLDVRALDRHGLLRAGSYFTWPLTSRSSIAIDVEDDKVFLLYRNRSFLDGEWIDVKSMVMLDWTPCHFGGSRVWWRCPAAGCGRRVAVLHGGSNFACRQCHRLTYRSQHLAADERASMQLKKVRRRLHWTPGIFNGPEDKPKGMHWATYRRLCTEQNALSARALDGMGEKIGALEAKLARMKITRR